QIDALFERELARITQPALVALIKELRVPTRRELRPWDYGVEDQTFPCWILLEHRASNTAVASRFVVYEHDLALRLEPPLHMSARWPPRRDRNRSRERRAPAGRPCARRSFAIARSRNRKHLDQLEKVGSQLCIPHRSTVRRSIARKIRFSTSSPKRITVNKPAKTSGISSWFFFSKTYQPSPPEPELTPNTSSAAISVRHANAQPILSPVRMLGKAPGIRIRAM